MEDKRTYLGERIELTHNRHTGRYLPHHHTSFAGLAFMLLLVTIVLAGVTAGAWAGTPYTGPDSGSIGLSGRVPAPPPTRAATITTPKTGQSFSATPITVSGTCPKDTIVEVFKNDIFAGAASCDGAGRFTLEIDLLYGTNALVARVYDALDQAGPDSNVVTVRYDALPQQADGADASNLNDIQMLLRSSPVYRGSFPGQTLKLPLEIIGGTPPFAVKIDWGDNKEDLLTRSDRKTFDASHTYARPGSYQVKIKATDNRKQSAYLAIIAIINGRAEINGAGSSQTRTPSLPDRLLLAWPLLALAVAMVVSFWLGEKREKRKLYNDGLISASTST